MKQIMRIGDTFVPADDNIKDIGNAGKEITDVAQKYKTDVLAIISKGDIHNLVTQYRVDTTTLQEDLVKIISLVDTIADTYKVNAKDIANAIKMVVDEL